MKRLLIVSPHFPPTDAVDMHRVRMNLGGYAAAGWAPTVLAAAPEAAERPIDPRLSETIPDEIERHVVGAAPARMTRRFGVSALGLRALPSLARAGEALLARAAAEGRPFDLAFFSTTVFPTMTLGRRWRARFGLPYVLDFQDPWSAAPTAARALRRQGLKHRAMRALHARLERYAAPQASGLIAVSPDYVAALQTAYPALRAAPALVSPFGWSAQDRAQALRCGAAWTAVARARAEGRIAALYAGRAGAIFDKTLRALFALMRAGRPDGALGRMRALFLGTGYQTAGNPEIVAPLAATCGLGARVEEAPDRAPLLDAMATQEAADLLIVLGSADDAYRPSKLRQTLAGGKPVLILAPRRGGLGEAAARLAAETPSVVFAPVETFACDAAGAPPAGAVAALDAALERALALPAEAFAARRAAQAPYEAGAMAAAEAALFDQALAASRAAASNRVDARKHGADARKHSADAAGKAALHG